MSKLAPKLYIRSKWCPIMSILERNVLREGLNHSSRHIRIWLSWLSKNLEIYRRSPILGILVLNIVNVQSRLTSLFSFNPLSVEK